VTREERHALLGPAIVKHIHECVDAAPDPPPELVAKLRRIMTNPAGSVPAPRPAVIAEPAADAA
jgi:hypothetical protein